MVLPIVSLAFIAAKVQQEYLHYPVLKYHSTFTTKPLKQDSGQAEEVLYSVFEVGS